jgi:hypothetical protein
MSTVIDKTSAARFGGRGVAMFWRFVWKEFRMLRGLWLAVAVMGLLVQCAERTLLPYSADLAITLFSTGIAAAVLFAVGAAATTFSVEHEDETYELLARLPAMWWPVFAGKTLVTATSALLLALVLSFSGFLPGAQSLSSHDAAALCGMLGFGIVEALAWGTLFSLLIKRPLLAAIVTLVVGAVTVNMVVTYSSEYGAASLRPESYVKALPLRLAIVVAVFAASIFAARKWLIAGRQSNSALAPGIRTRIARYWPSAIGLLRRRKKVAAGETRPRMLPRLLWQTWRENRKLLCVPVLLGFFLFAGVGAAIGLSHPQGDAPGLGIWSTLLFIPALYGAIAFYADQRPGNVRFLAEHAARPRQVWLARNCVWLGTLVAIWTVLMILGALWVLARLGFSYRHFIEEYLDRNQFEYPNTPSTLYETAEALFAILRGASLTFFGMLVAYSIGQFCSMAVRSEILAAFLSLLLSVVVAGWVFVVFFWQLSAWLFLMPLFVGFVLATWLRAPDWVAGRNSLRTWMKPAAAVIVPIVLIGLLLPARRLGQLAPTLARETAVVHDAIAGKLSTFQADNTPEARATAQMYVSAAERLASGITLPNLLERWEKPQYMDNNSTVVGGPGGLAGEIDPKKIPTDEIQSFLAAKEKLGKMFRDAQQAMVDQAVAASNRPSCRFELHLQSTKPANSNEVPGRFLRTAGDRHSYLVMSCPLYAKLEGLLDSMVMDDSLDHALAGLRMSAHLRSGQPSAVFIDQLDHEDRILQLIGDWAGQKKRTKVELQDALAKLTDAFQFSPGLESTLLADHLLVRDVITGKETPVIFTQTPTPLRDQLAFIANELPWERKRALAALDRITLRNIREIDGLTDHLNNPAPQEVGVSYIRRWLRPEYGGLPELWELEEPAAVTSYLASMEYKARVDFSQLSRACCDNEAYRQATLVQIGLATYRLDHKKYPPRLADLVPQYLAQLPLDPYSRQSFGYEPAGLNLPLEWWNGSRSSLTEPHSPLFWSVGPGDVRLKQLNRTTYQAADESMPDGEAREKQEPIYQFRPDQSWWGDELLVFLLPK